MKRMKLAILGGSSPFTAALIDAMLESVEAIGIGELVLYGRNVRNLEIVGRYAQRVLGPCGWTCRQTNCIGVALDGADYVVHQIRYGGLALRAEGERFCHALHLAADETLGPAALITALQMISGLRSTVSSIQRYCPHAWNLNLTNPLSSVTAVMCHWGLTRCVGICELPQVTLEMVAKRCQADVAAVTWNYAGLNHRGFLYAIRRGSRDLVEEFAEWLDHQGIPEISADVIRELQAVPLKYFSLVTDPTTVPPHRAEFLAHLREKILCELSDAPHHSPSSLTMRYLEWYPRAVVPMIAALQTDESSVQVVNVLDSGGVVLEGKAEVSSRKIELLRRPSLSVAAQAWLDRFERHERSFVRTMLAPTERSIRETISFDPVVPASRVTEVTRKLCGTIYELPVSA